MSKILYIALSSIAVSAALMAANQNPNYNVQIEEQNQGPAYGNMQNMQPSAADMQAMKDREHQLLLSVQRAIQEGGNHYNVNIHLSEGTVTLDGDVPTAQEKADIESRVSKVSGIKRVNNKINVSSR